MNLRRLKLFQLNYLLKIILLLRTFQTVINTVHGDRGSFVGCYRQNLHFRRLNIFSGSMDVCVDGCEHLYFRYAVLDGNACLCTNTISESELNFEECNRPCTENPNEFCGGGYAQSYYDTGIKVAGPPRNIQIINRTDTSILIQWTAPEQKQELSQYIIRANLLKKFGPKELPPLPQWSVEANDNNNIQYELINLNPGASYNISIVSYSKEHGEGGVNWIIGETMIGEPDPLPPQPQIRSQDGKTITIEVPSLVNNNGPVTAVQVIVLYIDSELSQQFDVGLLKNYQQALEDGTNYYITAELANENAARNFVVGNGLNYGGYDNVPLALDRHVHILLGIVSKSGDIVKRRYSTDVTHEQHDHSLIFVDTNNQNYEEGGSLELVLIIGCTLLGILLVLSIIGYLYLRFKMGAKRQRLPSDNHELTLQGPILEVENNGGYQIDDFSKKSFDEKLKEILDQVEPNKNFARNNLTLDVNNVIASGEFGDVITGKLNAKPCHVHVISDDMEMISQSYFLKELAALVQIGTHKNVVEFHGVCQSVNWLYLLFEDRYRSAKQILIESRTSTINDSKSFSSLSELFILQLLCELSTAMEFLSGGTYIHGKLNSHNVWITSSNIPKLAFFGTCFDANGKKIDLSRWSAPEVLRFQHHSTQSDVWSFGCLIWEFCSLGGTLYPSTSVTDLVGRIKDGTRPEHLPYVNDDMYQLLLNCWQIEPSERPTFSEITTTLWHFLSSPQHILSFKKRDGYVLPYYLPLLEEQET